VLAGSYQRLGKTTRISVQLIDTVLLDGPDIRFARRRFTALEDDVAQKVVEGLSVQLSGAEQEALRLLQAILRKLTALLFRRVRI